MEPRHGIIRAVVIVVRAAGWLRTGAVRRRYAHYSWTAQQGVPAGEDVVGTRPAFASSALHGQTSASKSGVRT